MTTRGTLASLSPLLVANRGEIAGRVLRTARRLGLGTVAVHSEADAGAPYLGLADAALCIGPAAPTASYLDVDRLLDAARRSGARALHPGYGFLSESAAFAEAVQAAGLVWVGPPPAVMRRLGDKAEARRFAEASGLPVLPGHDGAAQDDAALVAAAARLGPPLMVKAAAGGGGRGLRRVDDLGALAAALAGARAEALQACGSDRLILERALDRPRHLEVQIVGDRDGRVVHLGERDCSVQRRHQKLIEESPAPHLPAETRARLHAAALSLARAAGYQSAGTVEFLLDGGGAFHFLEVNTRLQVEHPVTEAVSGIDLVEWQLRVAAGEALLLDQEAIDARLARGGHAIEARLCAEDPSLGFVPATGVVARWQPPDGVRVDHALQTGAAITPHYDSLLAKLIAHGPDRAAALHRLAQALDELVLLGVVTNQRFLRDCLADAAFNEGRATTAFIEERLPPPRRLATPPSLATRAIAAALLLDRRARALPRRYPAELAGFSNSAALEPALRFELAGELHSARTQALPRGPLAIAWRCRFADGGDVVVELHGAPAPDGPPIPGTVTIDGQSTPLALAAADDGEGVVFRHAGDCWAARDASYQAAAGAGGAARATDGPVLAPMNGRVMALHVAAGQRVALGQPLLVIEAMKMQHTVVAARAGTVAAVLTEVGAQVAPAQVLVEMTPASSP